MTEDTKLIGGGDPNDDSYREINPDTGKQKDYLVLSDEERMKGFVRPVRFEYIHMKCGGSTRMHREIAETYARNPRFYDGTFCAVCGNHFPIDQFRWSGTDEILGT